MTDRLLIFAKQPLPGLVKTRLVPQLLPEDAASLYAACLRDVVTLAATGPGRLCLWYEGATGADTWFEREFPLVERLPQRAGDLGQKMADAFERCFAAAAERVVIIGSDSPTLPAAYIRNAFDDLHEIDTVLGPARDGGYYLIGIRRVAWPAAAHVFTDIAWSTPEVFVTTMARTAEAGLELRVLPGWYDVDCAEDLAQARTDAAPDSHLSRWFGARDASAP